MTARVFAPLPRILTRTFRETAPAVWLRHRDDGSTASDELVVRFHQATEEVDADGFVQQSGKPTAVCAKADALRLEPSRASGKAEAIFRNDGRDELIIDGRSYDVESCSHDGYGLLTLKLIG
ncbi:head-tail joining protein [Hoeflea olei]|uniref:Phage head-tail adapter protein n=1 Tax=Hoeflea olei TaxID=1480615 RepID=A0A1C1YRZ2_9HYPH|nr:hypothetical protein [Hoeflea olei]OCW56289.1 hypothetical protein AWJ14_19535 [Hoeflea olei]